MLNRADTSVGITHEDVLRILGRAPDVLVPSQRDIARSVNAGEPIVLVRASARSRRRRSARSPTVYRSERPGAGQQPAKNGRRSCWRGRDGAPRAHRGRPLAPSRRRPSATPLAEVKDRIHAALITELGPQLFNTDVDPHALRERVRREIREPPGRRSAGCRWPTASG